MNFTFMTGAVNAEFVFLVGAWTSQTIVIRPDASTLSEASAGVARRAARRPWQPISPEAIDGTFESIAFHPFQIIRCERIMNHMKRDKKTSTAVTMNVVKKNRLIF